MTSKAQRTIYIGRETIGSEGRPVTVDGALRATASLKAVVDKVQVEEDVGSFAQQRHYIGSLSAEGELEFDGYYEHAPYPISMALGVGEVGSPASGYYPWTWNLPDAGYYAFATYTLEYSDGGDHIVRSADVFATSIEVSGEAGKSWMVKTTLTGASTDFPAAVSATPTPPSPVTAILMANTTLYMDDDYINVGTTAVPVLVSFNWKLENFQHSKLFAGSLYPTSRGVDRWSITLEIIAEIEATKIEAEKAKLLSLATTAIKIAAVNGNNNAVIQGQFYLNEVDTLDDRDGNNTVKMSYIGQKSAGSVGAVTLGSTLASL